MTYHYVDYAAEAKANRKNMAQCYYRSRKYARDAAKEYKMARDYRFHAVWLSRHYDLVNECGATPADYERWALSIERLADTYLNSSFNEMDRAHSYANSARTYERMHAERMERLNG